MFALVLPWSTEYRGGVSVVVKQVAAQWQADGTPHAVVVDDWAARQVQQRGAEQAFRWLVWGGGSSGARQVWSALALPLSLLRVRRYLKATGCTGVNFHYPSLNALGVAMLKALGLYRGRLVLSFHGTDVRAPQTRLDAWFWRLIFAQADDVTTCSEALRQAVLSTWQLEPAQVHVAYNGVDQRVFCPSAQARHTGLIVSLGAYLERKGHRSLIDAMALLHRQGRMVSLTVVGGAGPELEALQRQIEEAGLAAFVQLLVDRRPDEVADRLREATMVVQPSLAEPFGLAVIEAAATGAPVVVSDAAGHLEIVTPGRTGTVFPRGDARACAAAIAGVLDDLPAAHAAAARLRREVAERFTWAGLAHQLRQALTPAKA